MSLRPMNMVENLKNLSKRLKILYPPRKRDKRLLQICIKKNLVFKENDWVLLNFAKARLRHRTGKATNGHPPTGHQKYYAKLAKRYYCPFQILKPINEMAYRLRLPSTWLIHNAFHVSLLKPYKGELPKEPIIEEPIKFKEQEEILQLESIL